MDGNLFHRALMNNTCISKESSPGHIDVHGRIAVVTSLNVYVLKLLGSHAC